MYAKESLDALILRVGGRLRRSRRWWKNLAIFVYRMLPLKVLSSASSSIFWTLLLIDCKKPGLMCVTRFMSCLTFRSLYGFEVCRLEGTMSPQARDATIKHFSTVSVYPLFALILMHTHHQQ